MVSPHLPWKFHANRSSRFAWIQNVTDDRQTTCCTKGATDIRSANNTRCSTGRVVCQRQFSCRHHDARNTSLQCLPIHTPYCPRQKATVYPWSNTFSASKIHRCRLKRVITGTVAPIGLHVVYLLAVRLWNKWCVKSLKIPEWNSPFSLLLAKKFFF